MRDDVPLTERGWSDPGMLEPSFPTSWPESLEPAPIPDLLMTEISGPKPTRTAPKRAKPKAKKKVAKKKKTTRKTVGKKKETAKKKSAKRRR